MDKYFEKALSLARRTGDRFIVYDSASRAEPVVIMGFGAYEELCQLDDPFGLTGDEDIDRINREADVFGYGTGKEKEPWERDRPEDADRSFWETDMADVSGETPFMSDPSDQARRGFDEGSDPDRDSRRHKPNWAIPTDRKAAAAEVLDEEDEDEDEDMQYLEEIRF